ncbi:MAG: formate dehydrogenase subunit gamma [Litoreibacter sp.]
MTSFRIVLFIILTALTTGFAQAQEDNASTPPTDRSATGGAQTLEDILARQRGEAVDDSFRRNEIGGADQNPASGQLGTLGGASDPELWRALRYNAADVTSSVRSPAGTVLVQDGGMWWLTIRQGPLLTYGMYLLAGTLVALALFLLLRGRIRIAGEKTGRRIERFKAIERFSHWMLAGSFILLGITGLISLTGRKVLIPLLGHENFAWIAIGSKWVHNNISWAFMIALVMIFVLWVKHNLPDRTDLNWLKKAGGLFGGAHPPAKKFNAGQKLIFWAVIILGSSISVSGLALLFPFELQMFAPTFAKLNSIGIPQALGMGELNTLLAPHQEMQYAQLWHAMVSFVLMAIILAHIYLGSVGMEGAFDAMGTGEVEEQWAREHHSLWVEEVSTHSPSKASAPAE